VEFKVFVLREVCNEHLEYGVVDEAQEVHAANVDKNEDQCARRDEQRRVLRRVGLKILEKVSGSDVFSVLALNYFIFLMSGVLFSPAIILHHHV